MEEILRRLAACDTPLVADALDAFDDIDPLGIFTGFDIKCLFPALGPMCGRVVTALVDSTTPGASLDDAKLVDVVKALNSQTGPCVVVLKAAGPDLSHTCVIGDQMAALFRRHGAVGVLTDAGVRDLAAVRELGFHLFAAGTVPSHGTFRVLDVNCPVEISGMALRPGDVVHGDRNGVIAIPESALAGLLDAISRRKREEQEFRAFLSADNYSLEKFEQRRARGVHEG